MEDDWAYTSQDVSRDRLLGTTVLLVGATGTTTCGSIDTTNQDATSVEDQTYTIPCSLDIEKTVSVRLEDAVGRGNHNVMQIAEVIVVVANTTKGKIYSV